MFVVVLLFLLAVDIRVVDILLRARDQSTASSVISCNIMLYNIINIFKYYYNYFIPYYYQIINIKKEFEVSWPLSDEKWFLPEV